MKNQLISCLMLIATLVANVGLAQPAPSLVCADKDIKCARKALKNHAAGRNDTWRAALSLPIAERIGPAPASLVEFIVLDNIANEYPDRPTAATMDENIVADVKAAVAELPPKLRDIFDRRLVGLYFVNGLGGTGYTDYVYDKNRNPVAAFIIFDAAVLAQKTANEWATWKENTPFKPDPVYRLQARIENDSNDNRKNAIQYILLHELGHVFSVGKRIHPPWNIEPKDVDQQAVYPFFNVSWKPDRAQNKYTTNFEKVLPQRRNTVYYFGAKLAAYDMLPTYQNLVQTNFPSLYAATHPGDDFAESFASYVHVVMMKRPWEIEISFGQEVVFTLGPCWGESRCAKKQVVLERLLYDAGAF